LVSRIKPFANFVLRRLWGG